MLRPDPCLARRLIYWSAGAKLAKLPAADHQAGAASGEELLGTRTDTSHSRNQTDSFLPETDEQLLLLHRLPQLSRFHGYLDTEPSTLNTYTFSQV